MALWIFTTETIEDLAANTLHRPDCRNLKPGTETEVHPAGSGVRRDVAPAECRRCRPELDLRLGV